MPPKKKVDIPTCKNCHKLLFNDLKECDYCLDLRKRFDKFFSDYNQGKLPKALQNKINNYLMHKILLKANGTEALFDYRDKFNTIYDDIIKYMLKENSEK